MTASVVCRRKKAGGEVKMGREVKMGELGRNATKERG